MAIDRSVHLNIVGRLAHSHPHRHTAEELDADPWHHGGEVAHAHNHCREPDHECDHHLDPTRQRRPDPDDDNPAYVAYGNNLNVHHNPARPGPGGAI